MTTGEAGVVAVTGIISGGIAMILGQVDAINEVVPNGALNSVGMLTSLGFTAWYCWYNESYAKPARDKTHADTIKEIVKEFRDDSREQRQAHATAYDKIDNSIDRLAIAIERTSERYVKP